MRLTLLTASTQSILGITATKNYLKVEHTTDDTLINTLMATAVNVVENYTGLITSEQTWRQDEEGDSEYIELIKAPVKNILEVKYYDDFDSTGSLLTESTDFRVASQYLVHDDDYWDKQRPLDGYQIKYSVGMYTTDPRMQNMEIAALAIVGFLYENREAYVSQVNETFSVTYDFSKTPAHILQLLRPICEGRGVGF